jgi:hypothetical protein
MHLSFLSSPVLNNRQLDVLLDAVDKWCSSKGVDIESEAAQAVCAIAIDLLERQPGVSTDELIAAISVLTPTDDGVGTIPISVG